VNAPVSAFWRLIREARMGGEKASVGRVIELPRVPEPDRTSEIWVPVTIVPGSL
jgi:hypothetical protein